LQCTISFTVSHYGTRDRRYAKLDISEKKDMQSLRNATLEEFVRQMSDLLRVERYVELEFTQEELNATTMLENNSEPPKPVEYLVTHVQAQQEQCDTICNLNVVSSSTGESKELGYFPFLCMFRFHPQLL
jgi:hypothetical protein